MLTFVYRITRSRSTRRVLSVIERVERARARATRSRCRARGVPETEFFTNRRGCYERFMNHEPSILPTDRGKTVTNRAGDERHTSPRRRARDDAVIRRARGRHAIQNNSSKRSARSNGRRRPVETAGAIARKPLPERPETETIQFNSIDRRWRPSDDDDDRTARAIPRVKRRTHPALLFRVEVHDRWRNVIVHEGLTRISE